MKFSTRLAMAVVALSLPVASFAQFVTGDVTGGGAVSGTVTSSNAWA